MATYCKHGARNPEYGGCAQCDYEENGAEMLSDTADDVEALEDRVDSLETEVACLKAEIKKIVVALGQKTRV